MDRLLYLLETNPRLTNAELAVMLGVSENEVKEQIRIYEESGVIKGYRAIIDKDKVNAKSCTALIEIKVQPKFGHGFDEVAQRIANLEEVESIYLMSGGYDLCCIVQNKSFEEVAMFVVKRLSPLEDVVSTTTNFILKKYKEQGISFAEPTKDDRGTISL
ncbi:Lrp/AsnC family transcriptional regulator [uncultured Eubacterium sp.]|uniref:Lrp/AsnC family transcriptional regulator n=1 Tax=uncultured Eubacterium sp. TaxID=165185 RepID=UPI0025F97F7C|nr:Lrp/AsnC family transcriptional regulator [uncultured Eubacterium sp.]